MDEAVAIGQLEALAHKLGVQVRYEHLDSEESSASGGLCRVRGRQIIIVDSKAARADKVKTLAGALRRFDLNGVYLRPAIRELLEGDEAPG